MATKAIFLATLALAKLFGASPVPQDPATGFFDAAPVNKIEHSDAPVPTTFFLKGQDVQPGTNRGFFVDAPVEFMAAKKVKRLTSLVGAPVEEGDARYDVPDPVFSTDARVVRQLGLLVDTRVEEVGSSNDKRTGFSVGTSVSNEGSKNVKRSGFVGTSIDIKDLTAERNIGFFADAPLTNEEESSKKNM